MEYSKNEQKLDRIQFITGSMSIGMVLTLQFVYFPVIQYMSNYLTGLIRYLSVFSIFLILDLYFTISNLRVSDDWEKHKYLRMNIGLLSAGIFIHIFFILPGIFNLNSDFVSSLNTRFILVTFIYLWKALIQIKIFNLFQDTYQTIKPMS